MAKRHGDSGDNTLRGTDGNDQIEGRGGNDKLLGLGGNDEIEGDSGNDRLYGGAGNDKLEGGSGNDILDAGKGANILEGDRGDDTFIFRGGATKIDDFGVGHDLIRIDDALGVDNFKELKEIAHNVGDDVSIDFGKHELHLDNISVSDLKASDFDFF